MRDREKHATAKRRWARDNVEILRASRRVWNKANRPAHNQANYRSLRRKKERIFELGAYRCAYCQPASELPYELLTVDHVVPLSRGGLDIDENKVPACFTCNKRKGRKTASEYRAWLRARGELPPLVSLDGLPNWSLDEEDAEAVLAGGKVAP